ncbi:MAG: histidine kinase [Betaproteobacteria bacterium]|nr:histidine kinase [Betaproteobacteria bacterium]
MDQTQTPGEQMAALVSHLAARRAAILQAWRESVNADAELTSSDSLPRNQFNDHIPGLLDAFQKRLQAWPRLESAAAEEKRIEDSAGHGLQRWQQGYQLREVTREWGHLQMCLVRELEQYAEAHAGLAHAVMSAAWHALSELCSQGISESTTQYFQLQQAEAEGHVRDMQETLAEASELDRRRTELFRQAAHDLRGNVGVVTNVTSGLTQYTMPEATREEFLRLLQKSVSSLQSMLDGALDLARLQAGHELRDIKPFSVADMLDDLVANLQPWARDRGLYLRAEGPVSLMVEGDAVKIRRIAQNLLLNALKYTRAGGVTLAWGDSRNNDPKRWMLCVQDTGPGIHAGPGAPLADALQGATQEARHVEEKATRRAQGHAPAEPAPQANTTASDSRAVHQQRGEGIGLSIVKRLCELLDASMELDSAPEVGTTFRIVFPRHYEAA